MKNSRIGEASKWLLIVFLFFSVLGTPLVGATEYSSVEEVTTQSDSVRVGRVVYYSKSSYCVDLSSCVKGKTPFPQHLWVTASGGYAGYIPIVEWYISPTDYVVTYRGNILKGPYVPTVFNQQN